MTYGLIISLFINVCFVLYSKLVINFMTLLTEINLPTIMVCNPNLAFSSVSRVYFQCMQPKCRRLWTGHLLEWPLTKDVTMKFSATGDIEHDPTFVPRRQASKEARAAVLRQLQSGKGPTEVFEDVSLKYQDKAPTIASVRRNRNPGVNRVPTQIQLLNLLRRTYESLIEPDGPVKGYIQVGFMKYFKGMIRI